MTNPMPVSTCPRTDRHGYHMWPECPDAPAFCPGHPAPDNARTTADNPATSSDEADNGLRARYSAAIDEGFRTFDADETDGYLIDHVTDAVLACRNADLAALRAWLSTEAAHHHAAVPLSRIPEGAQAHDGIATGLDIASRVVEGLIAGRGLPVSGGVKPEAGAGG